MIEKYRPIGDYRLYQEEVVRLVDLTQIQTVIGGDSFICNHMKGVVKCEIGYIKLEGTDNVRPYSMCCDCYQKLRNAGVATKTGTWEDLEND